MQTAGGCSTTCMQNNTTQLICSDSEKTGLAGSNRFSANWLDNGGVSDCCALKSLAAGSNDIMPRC